MHLSHSPYCNIEITMDIGSDNKNIDIKLIKLIEKFTSFKSKDIQLDTTLAADLGLDGLDAEAFDIDHSGFEFSQHFGSDGSGLDAPFVLLKVMFGRNKKYKQISVADLMLCIETKKWSLH